MNVVLARLGVAPLLLGAVVLAAAPPAAAQDSLPSLGGTVRLGEASSSEPLSGAVVEVRQGTVIRRTRSRADGVYRLEGLRPGPAELVVFHLAARTFEIGLRLPDRGPVEVDLSLRRQIIHLSGLQVVAPPLAREPIEMREEARRNLAAIGLRSLEASSGIAESGLASVLASDEPSEPDRVLYLRGSPIDARLVLLDGAPILTPFHVAGLVEAFDPELLGGADMYLGGAPSRYADGVSYLLDMETRPARRDRPRFALAADGLMVGGSAEIPLPLDGGLLAGGRLLHGLQESLGEGDRFPYRYDDLLLRAGFAPTAGHGLRVTGFQNHEGVRLALDGAAPDAEARWGNRALSAGYEGRVGAASLLAEGAVSRYESALPVNWSGAEPVLASGIGDRARFGVETLFGALRGTLRLGASVERTSFDYRFDPFSEAEALLSTEPLGTATTSSGAFGEWSGPVGPGLDLRAGIRADGYSHEGGVRISPRVAIALDLGEGVELHSSTGLYHQVLPASGLREEEDADGLRSLDWNPSLPVASAGHWVVELRQSFDSGVNLNLSGFLKTFSGLSGGAERSRSSGTEIRVSREGDRLSGWFGYALSWFWFEESAEGSTRFDGRHLLSAGLEGTLPGGIELRGTLGYGAGLPLTSVRVAASQATIAQSGSGFEVDSPPPPEEIINSGGGASPLELAPERDFLRLDLEAAWPLTPSLGGRSTQLRPYLKVVNALNRRDPLFYYFDRWLDEEVRPVAERPFLPLVGVEWRF